MLKLTIQPRKDLKNPNGRTNDWKSFLVKYFRISFLYLVSMSNLPIR